MKRISYIIGIVLLCSLAVEKAAAISYVTYLSPEERRQLTAEYSTLTAQRQRTANDLNNMCRVLASAQEMFVYNLKGSNRWEFWTTKQVSAHLQRISRNQATYQWFWRNLAAQHRTHCRFITLQVVPNLRAKLDKINKRLAVISRLLATNVGNQKRPNLTNVVVNKSPVYVRIWDHGDQDGDIVAVYVNGIFKRKITLSNRGTTLTLPLAFGHHRLQVVALEKGSKGLNTASVKVTGVVKGKPEQAWKLERGEQTTMWITVGN
ncbi:MAG: hypothetical protein QGH60_05595 [Phycisphaerae bacterium]|jgi:hypothetical protein|nr:hypothetical protein [Phycisphaerae bacterium]